jgi:hypothetical protein
MSYEPVDGVEDLGITARTEPSGSNELLIINVDVEVGRDFSGFSAVTFRLNPGSDITSKLTGFNFSPGSQSTSFGTNITYTFSDKELCGSEAEICIEVTVAGKKTGKCAKFNRNNAEGSICNPVVIQSSASVASTLSFEKIGTDVSLAPPNTCIKFSSAGTAVPSSEEGRNICLSRGTFTSQTPNSITFIFYAVDGLKEPVANGDGRYTGDFLGSMAPEAFPLMGSASAWKTSEGCNDGRFYVVCTTSGPKTDWDTSCYLMETGPTRGFNNADAKVNIWKVK